MMNAGNGKKFMSEINVTPFVDVMLVLLIIFMVTAPMMIEGVAVDLPQTTAKPVKTSEDPPILSITKKREIFLEDHAIDFEDLEMKIRTFYKYRDNKEMLFRGDKDVPYGFVVKVMAGIKRAGIDKLDLVTEPDN